MKKITSSFFTVLLLVLLTMTSAVAQQGNVPTIGSFSPLTGSVGTNISISGSNFSTTASANIVWIGTTRATVAYSTSNLISIAVPAVASHGIITVLNTETMKSASSQLSFHSTFSPNNITIVPGDFSGMNSVSTNAAVNTFASADLNGDGRKDIIVGNSVGNIEFLSNTIQSGIVSFLKTTYATNMGTMSSIRTGDVDNDGKIDLVISNLDGAYILRNISVNGTISFASPLHCSPESAQSTTIADFNGDGKPDIAVVHSNSTVSVLINNGTVGNISFETAVVYTAPSIPNASEAFDIDLDGKIDLIINGGNNSVVSILRNTTNNGTVSFANAVNFSPGQSPNKLSIADIDQDGKHDIIVANALFTHAVSVLRNTSSVGNIAFASPIVLIANNFGPQDISIGDLNGDGKPDLVVSNSGTNAVSIFQNNSFNGAIAFDTRLDHPFGTHAIKTFIEDMDGDGKNDIVTAYNSQLTLYTSTPQTPNNNNLAGLILSASQLSQGFSSSNTTYTSNAPSTAATTTVTATSEFGNSTMALRINSGEYVAITSGVASQALPLNVGNNVIDIRVTAPDSTIKVYTVTVYKPSGLARLSNLTMTTGTLSPVFSSAQKTYTATTEEISMRIFPTAAEPNSSIQVSFNGGSYVPLGSSPQSQLMGLNPGSNTISIRIYSMEQYIEHYTITVTRLTTNANLATLYGSVFFTFTPTIYEYEINVPVSRTTFQVSPTAASNTSTVRARINGGPYTVVPYANLTPNYPIFPGTNLIEVKVTADDGILEKIYKVNIIKPGGCPTANVTLETQAAVDDFAVTYPYCTIIPDNLSLTIGSYSGQNDITNLNGIQKLTKIGTLFVANTQLTDLNGLSNVTSCTSINDIAFNNNLTSLSGLNKLTTLASLSIRYNSNLNNLTALSGITTTTGTLELAANSALNNLSGLGQITSVNSLYISDHAQLTALPFTNLTSVGNLSLINTGVTSLSGLSNLNAATLNNLTIENNQNLIFNTETPFCTYLSDNTKPATIANNTFGSNSRQQMLDSCFLSNVATLSSLSSLDGTISPAFSSAEYNYSINVLSPQITLNAVATSSAAVVKASLNGGVFAAISGTFNLNAGTNTILINVLASNQTDQLTYTLTVTFQPCPPGDITLETQADVDQFMVLYPSCTALVSGSTITIGRYFDQDITNLDGIQNITSVHHFKLNGTLLNNLSEMSQINTINGHLHIVNNNQMTSLSGLGSFASIEGMQLYDNTILTDVSALGNINNFSSHLYIYRNTALTDLSGLETINMVGQFSIDQQPLVTSLPLTNLKVSSGLYITNTGITSLSGLASIDQNPFYIFSLIGNHDLQFTGSPSICNVVNNPMIYINVSDNAPGSNSKAEMAAFCIPSDNANLSALSISNGTLNPAFTSSEINYTATVTNAMLTVSAIAEETGSTIKVKLNSGSFVPLNTALTLNPGVNTVTVSVLAPNTIAEKLYTLTITFNPCPETDITLETQADVDQFIISYPYCTTLANGSTMTIGRYLNQDITNLDGIQNITSVHHFKLNGTLLANLSEISQINTINGHFYIANNNQMTSLSGLGNFAAIGGLQLYDNNVLTDVSALGNITNYTSFLMIYRNAVLSDLSGMGTINSTLFFSIDQQPLVTSLPLTNLRVSSSVVISNTGITSLSGLSSIDQAPFYVFNLMGNHDLQFTASASICNLLSNPMLYFNASDNATGSNSKAEMVSICNQSTVATLSALTTSTGSLTPGFSSAQTSYNLTTGLSEITVNATPTAALATVEVSVNNGIYQTDTTALSLNQGTNSIKIRVTASNGYTQNTYTLQILSQTCPENYVELSNQTEVDQFIVLYPNCTSMDEYSTLQIGATTDNIPPITNLNGLQNLTSVSDFMISYTALTDLSGLSNLTEVRRVFGINSNANLTSLSGIENMNLMNAYYFQLESNPNLQFTTMPSVCDYLSNSWNSASVFGNAAGSSSRAEMVNTCLGGTANANLLALHTDAGYLDQPLTPQNANYTITVSPQTTTINIITQTYSPDAVVTISINGGSYVAASVPLALTLGDNTINVKVVAADGVTTKIYTISLSMTLTVFYYDADGDGYGNADMQSAPSYFAPENYVADASDCNDNDATVHAVSEFYEDYDGDGYGYTWVRTSACSVTPPVGYVANDSDCDDNDPEIYRLGFFYRDNDGDGYEVGLHQFYVCYGANIPDGFSLTTLGWDCNDNDPTIYPDIFTVSASANNLQLGQSTTLTVNGSNTYTWSPADGLTATTGTSVIATPENTTTYTVTSSGCGMTQTITVRVLKENALDFDGTDDYIEVPYQNEYIYSYFTVEAWIKPAHQNKSMHVFSTREGDDNSFDIQVTPNGLHADIGDGYSWLTTSADANYTFNTNEWTHVAYVITMGEYKIYANGNLIGNGNFSPWAYPALLDPYHRVTIGKNNSEDTYFEGAIDEIRVYKAALTAQQIQLEMASKNPLYPQDLAMHYDFGVGTPGGNNAGLTALPDLNQTFNGTLHNFTLNGNNSNWVNGYTAPNCSITSTWNGTTWINGYPLSNYNVVIDGDLNIGNDLSACQLTVGNNAEVIVASGVNLNVAGSLTVNDGAKLTFENNSYLFQDSATTTNSNSGNISYKRNVTMRRLDYVYWGSPVAGQNLKAFSPQTVSPPIGVSRFYTLNEQTNSFAAVDPLTTSFESAKGFMVRAPNTFPANGNLATFTGTFTGVPNNGNYSTPISHTPFPGSSAGFNMLGNPYPSPVNATEFLNENPGTLYFWTHGDQSSATNNYATFNLSGTTPISGPMKPNGYIQSGQGFLLHTAILPDGTMANFTNAMREQSSDDQFYRSGQKDRFWLNLSNENTASFNQALIGYFENATLGADVSYDGKLNYNGTSISSKIANDAYAIQARSLPFTITDEVPLCFKTAADGNFTLAIEQMEGLFNGQEIYLKDNVTGITHDIKQSAYSFASVAGDFNDRFSIVYQNTTLGIEPVLDANSIVIFKQNGIIAINSGKTIMDHIKVFDIRGRLLFEKKAIGTTSTVLDGLISAQQVLLIQITSENNKVITKKMVN